MIGNSTFIMFHEAGHMLISELGLPVLGREEDAVDTLSAILLLEGRDETLDQAITDSADGWFLSGEQMAEDDEYAFWDSHGIDDQRAYQIVCMMVGHDARVSRNSPIRSNTPRIGARNACPNTSRPAPAGTRC